MQTNNTCTEKRISLSYRSLKSWAIAYAALPLFLFLVAWLKPVIGIPLGLLTVIGVVLAIQPEKLFRLLKLEKASNPVFASPIGFFMGEQPSAKEAPRVSVSRTALIVLAGVAVVWCILGGQGGFWAQSTDWSARNALYRDLITHSWPVYYNDGDAALSYYIAYWLPPALVAKLPLLAGIPIDAAWQFANVVLLAWTAVGVFLVELLVLATIRPRSQKAIWFCIALLVLFSTPDLLGLPITGKWDQAANAIHLERWATGKAGVAQYSCLTTCLFWVFNQTVIPWICTLCFLNERRFSNYLLIWACCFNAGPLPSVGLAILMLAQGVAVLAERHRLASLKQQLLSLVSLQNVVGIAAAIIVALFFLTNTATANTGANATIENLLEYPLWLPDNRRMIITAFVFVLIEGLLIPACLFKTCRNMPLYWAIVITLVMCPFIRIGQSADFCMRASIPALMCLYVLCAKHLLTWFAAERPRQVGTWALIVILAIGACTPLVEFYRGFYQVATMGIENVHPDNYTFEGSDFSVSNFGSDQPEESMFFGYLAG